MAKAPKWGTNNYKQTWVYAVPISRVNTMFHGHRLGKLAEDAGIWEWTSLGRGRVYAAPYRSLFDFTVDSLKKNPVLTENAPKRKK